MEMPDDATTPTPKIPGARPKWRKAKDTGGHYRKVEGNDDPGNEADPRGKGGES
jgi:hypothetical protein